MWVPAASSVNLIHPLSPLKKEFHNPSFFPPTADFRRKKTSDQRPAQTEHSEVKRVDTDKGEITALTPVDVCAKDSLESLHCRTLVYHLDSLLRLGTSVFGMDMSSQQEYPGLKDGEISTGVSPLCLLKKSNRQDGWPAICVLLWRC